MNDMKVLLTAINAKYIHSNLAVHSLKAYAQSYLSSRNRKDLAGCKEKIQIDIAEYTINQQPEEILKGIYRRRPDILCFSCYIWNIAYVEELVQEVSKILPQTLIWFGGPEVSYCAEEILSRMPEAAGVIKGEGEETFARVIAGEPLEEMEGITYREADGRIAANPWRPEMDINDIPFVYRDMKDFSNRILYYESSRGCPFSCSYCLSSVDRKLRFRDRELVKEELKFLIDQKVPQVKFVDRTFNCRREHAIEIWSFIKAHDKGITNFHFEISADLLDEEEIKLLQSMRPGLVQLEAGIQSTNPRTIRAIRRSMKFEKAAERIRAVAKHGNIHQHLDLIAGLPFEDMASFERSFNEVYELHPQQLQLGFLKVLKGSPMEEMAEEYGLVYKGRPPYEVLATKWLSYDDILCLKGIEEVVEICYNSGQFTRTLPELLREFASPFAMYQDLAAYYERGGFDRVRHTRAARYEIVLGFVKEKAPGKAERFRDLLTYDYYLRENAKNRPAFAGGYSLDKEEVRAFYSQEGLGRNFLPGYEGYDRNQIRKMTHLERFEALGQTALFDYVNRHPLTKNARVVCIDENIGK